MFDALIEIHPFYSGYGYTGTLPNSKDPDEMLHKAAVHQGLHYLLLKINTILRDSHILKFRNFDP